MQKSSPSVEWGGTESTKEALEKDAQLKHEILQILDKSMSIMHICGVSLEDGSLCRLVLDKGKCKVYLNGQSILELPALDAALMYHDSCQGQRGGAGNFKRSLENMIKIELGEKNGGIQNLTLTTNRPDDPDELAALDEIHRLICEPLPKRSGFKESGVLSIDIKVED